MNILNLDTIGLFIFISGFVIGLGSVTVIDIHGFLGRKSPYWTAATISAHKVTKPLIWAGIILAIFGGSIYYRNEPLSGIPLIHALIAIILILNGVFLSFKVSPYLLEKEKQGKANQPLPQNLQNKIIISLLFSDLGWWTALFLLAIKISS